MLSCLIKISQNVQVRTDLWEFATTAENLIDDAHESLFRKVLRFRHHVLDELLPPTSEAHHNLRKRRHDQTLPEKKGHLSVKNNCQIVV